jgi:hypothetical protein
MSIAQRERIATFHEVVAHIIIAVEREGREDGVELCHADFLADPEPDDCTDGIETGLWRLVVIMDAARGRSDIWEMYQARVRFIRLVLSMVNNQ